ncbi:hypothetical protein [uncultured Eubacterium sp.]|uniref:hypothetical protein n=1 Tax=uncultured Eubacterium sp. TaxID=165185 RepID=UPI0015B799E3|nr:hypothetical protein [uncultured Eubacterium sp.]
MNSKYIDKTHTYGRVWILVTLALFLSIPALICYHLNVFPKAEMVFKGLATVAVVFYPTAILEVLTYTPLLGTGGTYLGFVTGNITNLKLPVALSAMENAKVEPNTEKGEVISTISIAVSSIVTTVIIAVCVILFRPVLHNITDKDSVFAPAFQQVTPALFGALCASYLAKHWKISILPILSLVIVLLFSGKLGTGVLIPVGVVISLLGAHIMFKKGWLD